MKIVGTGFLSAEGVAAALRIADELAPQLLFTQQAIELCHLGLLQIRVASQQSEKEKQKVIACVVLARLLEISEAMVLLARGGFSVEVTSSFRTFLDAYFVFGNVCNDATFIERYFQSDLEARRKLISAAFKHKIEPFDLINDYATKDVKDDLGAKITEVNALKFDSYKHALDIGCQHIYDSMYRVSSAATHSTPRALEEYVREDNDENVSDLLRKPQAGNIGARLLDLSAFLLNVRTAFDEVFELDGSAQVNQLKSRLHDLSRSS